MSPAMTELSPEEHSQQRSQQEAFWPGDQWKGLEEYIMFRIAKRVAQLKPDLESKGIPPLMLSIGAPTAKPPQALIDKVKEYLDDASLHGYSVPRGEPYFRKGVADRLKNRFGVTIDPETEVCSLIGSKEGLLHMFRALITPRPNKKDQDIILTPNPGYASYVDAINSSGGHAYSVPYLAKDRYMPDLDALMNQLAAEGYDPNKVKALIINYPSNPVGAPATFAYYQQVIEFACKRNILVISDNAYADMYFGGEAPPHSILEVPNAKDIAVEFHSLSKPYAVTGWRLGFAVGNPVAIDMLIKAKGTADSGLSKFMQKAAVFALTSPECDQFIADMNKVYEKKQAIMVEGLGKLGWPIAEINPPRATFYLWLPIPKRFKDCNEYATQLLEKAGIVVVPGTAFGTLGEGYIRMSLVIPDEELTAVLDRLAQFGFAYHG